MKPFCLLFLLPLALFGAEGGTPFNVRDFGATGNGQAKDTAAFQQALDACAAAGGGEVLVPAGEYLTGSLELKSYTTLRLEREAVILGSPDLADYPVIKARWEGRWVEAHRALLSANNASHVTIIGYGRIAGNPAIGSRSRPRRPCVIEPIECTDVRLEDLTVTQSQMWTIHPTCCDNVVLKNVIIRGTGSDSTGVIVDSCRHVRLEGCDIESGDDCVAIKSGRDVADAREARPTEDVLIRDCTFAGLSAGVALGRETSGGIREVRIEGCRFRSTPGYAIQISSRAGRGATIQDILAQDLDVQSAPGGFLQVNLREGDPEDSGPDGIPAARNFHFTNVRVNCGALVDAVSIPPEKPLDGFVLENITGTATKGIALAHMVNVTLANLKITGVKGDFVTTDGVTGAGLDGAGR
jgi:polygalacturonase